MMKNLRKYALISLLMVLAIVVLSTTSNASGEFLQGSGSEGDLLLVDVNQTSENTTTTPEPNTVSTNILGTTNNVQKVKELGLVRLEGKDYVMQEGDIVEFKFNV